jgi:EAL domain-containing protein (putative c-di-GMP-specific phosphodiesterase class I)
VSLGIARYPQDGESADEILHNADSAMYQSKDPGHRGFALFRRADDAQVQARNRLSAELRQAISRQELELYYQPQVDVRSGVVTAAEALLRWRHPEHGLLLPGTFIPLAEENGMILDIGSWVLEEACRTLAAWRSRGLAPGRVSINVAPRQFCHGPFARDVHRQLTNRGLPPESLELEITESVLAAPGAAGHQALGQLASLGVRLVIDDFGTGYAGVGLLKGLPVHGMKVDRTFVHDVPDRAEAVAGAEAIVALAGALGKDLIVEGVETREQLAFFRQRDCRVFQGYLFSEPLSRRDFETAAVASERFAVA